MNPDQLRRTKTGRLRSWQRQYKKQLAQKQSVAAKHKTGTAYHTRATREAGELQRRLQMIESELTTR